MREDPRKQAKRQRQTRPDMFSLEEQDKIVCLTERNAKKCEKNKKKT